MITFCWFLTMAALLTSLVVGLLFTRRVEVLEERISQLTAGSADNPFDLD